MADSGGGAIAASPILTGSLSATLQPGNILSANIYMPAGSPSLPIGSVSYLRVDFVP